MKAKKRFIMYLILLLTLVIAPTVSTIQTSAAAHEGFLNWYELFDYVIYPTPPTITVNNHTYLFGLPGNAPIINVTSGTIMIVNYIFIYVGPAPHRLALIWFDRLGFDFAVLGEYINGMWIGAKDFVANYTDEVFNATIVLEALHGLTAPGMYGKPALYDLQVGVAIQDVGNSLAAPDEPPAPPLYGVFINVTGGWVEPLQGMNLAPIGFVPLLNWPWLPWDIAAEFIIGAAAVVGFILLTKSYQREESEG